MFSENRLKPETDNCLNILKELWFAREDHSSHTLRQLKSPLSNISSLGLAGLKSTGIFVIQGVTHR